MATPPNATNPSNDAFAGGNRTVAANPLAVGGTIGGPGAASAPPGVGQPQILSARNNSGSNVRIPYARLVPMRGKRVDGPSGEINWASIPDISTRGGEGGPLFGRPIGQEYDGLETGELCWIMGRKLLTDTSAGGTGDWEKRNEDRGGIVTGFGVDRMQRLAYTSWLEAYFRAVFGQRRLQLTTISLSGPKQVYMSSDLNAYAAVTAGASVLCSVDLPHVINGIVSGNPKRLEYKDIEGDGVPVLGQRGAPAAEGLASGLLVVDKGPFLRGKIVNDDSVDMVAIGLNAANSGAQISHAVPRNMGDRLAFDALYAEMRAQNFFDWSPDGIVLSKLESPAGEPMSSAELDARQAQLFNVCVQGPAIAKSWTGDSRLQCMPMDKVFVVIVAGISSTIGGPGAGRGSGETLPTRWEEYAKFINGKGALGETPTNPNTADTGEPDPASYAGQVKELFKQQGNTQNVDAATRNAAISAVEAARAEIEKFYGPLKAKYDNDVSGRCKQGLIGFEESEMTNFRLMRVTSSFLANSSACVVTVDQETGKETVDPKSRCGLRLGMKGDKIVTGEYIIGGWCIGTVMDSAASRSSVGNVVRTNPASMAINVNVNVEWWSGDDLHKRYMDVDRTVQQRGQVVNSKDAADLRAKGLDVSLADIEEALSWSQ